MAYLGAAQKPKQWQTLPCMPFTVREASKQTSASSSVHVTLGTYPRGSSESAIEELELRNQIWYGLGDL